MARGQQKQQLARPSQLSQHPCVGLQHPTACRAARQMRRAPSCPLLGRLSVARPHRLVPRCSSRRCRVLRSPTFKQLLQRPLPGLLLGAQPLLPPALLLPQLLLSHQAGRVEARAGRRISRYAALPAEPKQARECCRQHHVSNTCLAPWDSWLTCSCLSASFRFCSNSASDSCRCGGSAGAALPVLAGSSACNTAEARLSRPARQQGADAEGRHVWMFPGSTLAAAAQRKTGRLSGRRAADRTWAGWPCRRARTQTDGAAPNQHNARRPQ